MITDINSEDLLVQTTFAEHLEKELGWENVYAWNREDFGPDSLQRFPDCQQWPSGALWLNHQRMGSFW